MFSIKGLSFQYQDKCIFNDAQVEFENTSLVCIHGKSGCGKTTLLKILAFDLCIESGIIQYNNQNINLEKSQDFLFNHMTYIDQDCTCLNHMTLYQHFEFYATLHGVMISDEIIRKYLELVRLENIDLKKYPAYLSTGQRKRFMLSVGLLIGKDILLLDEPTASLDTANKKQLIEVLKKISKKCLIICTSHDEFLLDNADDVYEISDYQILEQKKTSQSSQLETSQSRPLKVKYSKYKNFKIKFLFIVLFLFSCLLSFIIPFSVSLSMDLTSNISEQEKATESTGLIFSKLSDARLVKFDSPDFLSSEDLDKISHVENVKSISPYYCLLDGKARDVNDTMTLTSLDGQKDEYKFYWEKLSKKYNIDYYADIAIMSYAPNQNIKVDGKIIDGIYIDENFQEVLGERIKGGELLSFPFSLPIEYREKINFNDDQARNWQPSFQENEISLKVDGVMPDSIYADENGNSHLPYNYMRIYMPIDQIQSLLKKYALGEKHIYNHPMTYLILCEAGEKDNVKMDIEKIDELYQTHYQIEGVQYSSEPLFSSSYMLIFMCSIAVLGFVVLSYYQFYMRGKEILVLKREGLVKEIRKYYMRDYYHIGFGCFIVSIMSCSLFIYLFQFKQLDILTICLYWFFMTVIIIICFLIIGYHGIYMAIKRKNI